MFLPYLGHYEYVMRLNYVHPQQRRRRRPCLNYNNGIFIYNDNGNRESCWLLNTQRASPSRAFRATTIFYRVSTAPITIRIQFNSTTEETKNIFINNSPTTFTLLITGPSPARPQTFNIRPPPLSLSLSTGSPNRQKASATHSPSYEL